MVTPKQPDGTAVVCTVLANIVIVCECPNRTVLVVPLAGQSPACPICNQSYYVGSLTAKNEVKDEMKGDKQLQLHLQVAIEPINKVRTPPPFWRKN